VVVPSVQAFPDDGTSERLKCLGFLFLVTLVGAERACSSLPCELVAALYFFPRLQTKRDEVGPYWRSRVALYLFLDWDAPISNNKLKLTVCPLPYVGIACTHALG